MRRGGKGGKEWSQVRYGLRRNMQDKETGRDVLRSLFSYLGTLSFNHPILDEERDDVLGKE